MTLQPSAVCSLPNPASKHSTPELWIGPECTINRIGNRWRDQSELTGFAGRVDHLERLATLGARRVRFPLLWESVAAAAGGELDFSWSDRALSRLREKGVEPIVGLLHHGSGPRGTSLIDRRFPKLFADYASCVAQRYPEQRAWTPINEPLTTARFSCLYGLWYPHRQDDRSFVRALLNQIHATVRAMDAIRAVNPDAELVQTEDLGFTRATPALAHQAAFDNERRWLTFDLLCGRVDSHHLLWDWLRGSGASVRELRRLQERPCPPHIVGINAYVTSERFLDERMELHPAHLHGGNGRQAYADVETVRAHGELISGFAGRLREAYARYGLPIAITEVHMGCTREEQMRWLHQAWVAACDARREGIDVRALTAWAAFGTMDWSSLLTREAGHYEPGLWDVRSGTPRLTALGQLAASLAKTGEAGSAAPHPVLAGPGWWQRDLRLIATPHGEVSALPARGASVLITGNGRLGRAFARLCHMRGLPYVLLSHQELDIADEANVAQAIALNAPWAVINAAGYTRVDAAEADARQWRANARGPEVLAAACNRAAIRLLTFSSDFVFAGDKRSPYLETDPIGPLNAYGRAKAHAERAVLTREPGALVIRSGCMFGPWDDRNFVTRGLALLRQGARWTAPSDQVVSPTYVPDLVQAALDLLIDGERGLWHLTNGHPLSWRDFARLACEHARLDAGLVQGVVAVELGQIARRPAFSALASDHGVMLPTLDDALSRYQRDHEPIPAPPPPLRAIA